MRLIREGACLTDLLKQPAQKSNFFFFSIYDIMTKMKSAKNTSTVIFQFVANCNYILITVVNV